MFTPFFHTLRDRGIPVTPTSFLRLQVAWSSPSTRRTEPRSRSTPDMTAGNKVLEPASTEIGSPRIGVIVPSGAPHGEDDGLMETSRIAEPRPDVSRRSQGP